MTKNKLLLAIFLTTNLVASKKIEFVDSLLKDKLAQMESAETMEEFLELSRELSQLQDSVMKTFVLD